MNVKPQTLHQRKLRADRLAKGLCAVCGKRPFRDGITKCERCADYAAEQQRQLRATRIAAGLCYRCGKYPPRTNPTKRGRPARHLSCEPCAEKTRRLQQKRRKTGKALYQRRRAAGLCISCGAPPEESRVHCSACLKRRRLRYARKKYGGNAIDAMERDDLACQLCGATLFLHVHHIDGEGYDSDEPNNALDNLVTLCNRCHYGITLLTTRGVNRARAIELLSE